MTTVSDGLYQFGGMPVSSGFPLIMMGNVWFVDPANGSDGYPGTKPSTAFRTLYKAHQSAVDGNNDVIFLIGNGQTSGSARLSLANAQLIDSSATAGTLVWNKNATHLIGIAGPTIVGSRARIAPPTGTYTQATFGSGNFVNVTGAGCCFANLSVYNGFSTGDVDQIAWTENGGRNYYYNVNIQGMADAASAADTGSTSLLVKGTGECTFDSCAIGLDTVTRSNAHAEITFSGGTPRNTFRNCHILTISSDGANAWVQGGADAIDRWALFDNCVFTAGTNSAGTALGEGFLTNAAPGGSYLLKNCLWIGATHMDSTNSKVFTNLANAATAGGLVTTASA